MTKELQDLVWSVLPKEFKEEVKELYKHENKVLAPIDGVTTLNEIFGIHNLTSDAEGEEMLTISRKELQKQYQMYKNMSSLKRLDALMRLFGSKCLPDEEQPKQKDCDNPLADKEGCRWRNDGKCAFDSACYFEPLNPQEPKPAEPKFKVCDYAMMNGRKVEIIGYSDHFPHEYYVHVLTENYQTKVNESDLEPYPSHEPQENVNLSQNPAKCDKDYEHDLCDKLIQRGFSAHNRLYITAMAMQAILSNPNIIKSRGDLKIISKDWLADGALEFADTLIAECEKGAEL